MNSGDLFEYIEPADINLNVYSYKIQQLLARTCMEIEANFKAIFKENKFCPFQSWAEGKSLEWYQAYNDTKHNRIECRDQANLRNLLSAYSALAIVLAAQFRDNTFEPGATVLALDGGDSYYGDVEYAMGDYLIIEYPNGWKEEYLYNFEWSEIKDLPEKFRKYDYDEVKA